MSEEWEKPEKTTDQPFCQNIKLNQVHFWILVTHRIQTHNFHNFSDEKHKSVMRPVMGFPQISYNATSQ
jgi:hypothetical protein